MLVLPNAGSVHKTFTRAQMPEVSLFLPYNLYGQSTEQPDLNTEALILSVQNATITVRFSGPFTNLPSLAETHRIQPNTFNQFIKQAIAIGALAYTSDVRPFLGVVRSLRSLFNEIVGEIPTFEPLKLPRSRPLQIVV